MIKTYPILSYPILWHNKSICARLIVRCLMPFATLFKLYCSGQSTYPCFPGVLLTSAPHNILFKPLAAFQHNHCQKMESGERGMNLLAMAIINPQKKNTVLKSCTLPTKLRDLASTAWETMHLVIGWNNIRFQWYKQMKIYKFTENLSMYKGQPTVHGTT